MPPNQTAERVDNQIAHAEVNGHAPNLLQEYGQQEIELFGVKGTVEELITMCPHGDKLANGTIEVNVVNDFIIRGINESGSSVKEEHFSLFSERLTEMGKEVKVTIREEASEEGADKDSENQAKADSFSVVSETKYEKERKIEQPKVAVSEQSSVEVGAQNTEAGEIIDKPAPRKVVGVLSGEAYTSTDQVPLPETKDMFQEESVSIAEWFDTMAKEYAEYLRQPQVAAPEAELVDEVLHADAASEAVDTAHQEDFSPKQGLSNEQLHDEVVATLGTAAQKEHAESDTGTIIEIPGSAARDTMVSDDHEAEQRYSENNLGFNLLDSEREKIIIDNETTMPATEDEASIMPATLTEEIEGEVLKIPAELAELFIESEENELQYTQVGERTTAVEFTEETTTLEDLRFIAGIHMYLAQQETKRPQFMLEVEAEQQESVEDIEATQPRQAFAEILDTVQQLQQIQTKIESLTVTGHIVTEDGVSSEQLIELATEKETLQAELYEICEQFLESIGVEPTEKKVQALVDRVLKIDFKEIEKEHQFSPEQLATMGTHEYKVGDWFQKKTKQAFSLPVLSPHKIIGLFALQHLAVD